jgi:hypothetical protein
VGYYCIMGYYGKMWGKSGKYGQMRGTSGNIIGFTVSINNKGL